MSLHCRTRKRNHLLNHFNLVLPSSLTVTSILFHSLSIIHTLPFPWSLFLPFLLFSFFFLFVWFFFGSPFPSFRYLLFLSHLFSFSRLFHYYYFFYPLFLKLHFSFAIPFLSVFFYQHASIHIILQILFFFFPFSFLLRILFTSCAFFHQVSIIKIIPFTLLYLLPSSPQTQLFLPYFSFTLINSTPHILLQFPFSVSPFLHRFSSASLSILLSDCTSLFLSSFYEYQIKGKALEKRHLLSVYHDLPAIPS